VLRPAHIATVLVLGAVAGCGGDPPALSRSAWASKANAACVKAMNSIADRGWPVDITEIKPRVGAAAKDIHAAADRIRALPRPKGNNEKIDALVGGLDDIDPVLSEAARAGAAASLDDLDRSADKLGEVLTVLEGQAGLAGLDDCLAENEDNWVPDAIRAPVYAEHLSRVQREYVTKERKIANAPAVSLGQRRRRLTELSGLLAQYAAAAREVKPPWWVKLEVNRHTAAVRRLQHDIEDATAELSGTRPPLPERLRQLQARVVASGRAEGAAYRKLWKRLGADPVTSPAGSSPGTQKS
jgi:hypothetical protein